MSPHFARAAPPETPRDTPPPQPAQHAALLEALSAYLRGCGGASLPPGWRAEVKTRGSGASAGHVDVYFLSPDGKRCRSRLEVARHLGLAGAASQPSAPSAPPLARRRAAPLAASPAPPRVASPFFAPPAAAAPPPRAPRHTVRRVDAPSWVPPPSPYGLIQETLFADPWKVLVACILLNHTTCGAVRHVIWDLFQLVPTPEAALAAPEAALARIIAPLGLVKRASYIRRMSEQYLRADWASPEELCGCGRYAADAYALFVSGAWRELPEPEDKELKKYHRFLHETVGKGRGLARDPPPRGVRIPGLAWAVD